MSSLEDRRGSPHRREGYDADAQTTMLFRVVVGMYMALPLALFVITGHWYAGLLAMFMLHFSANFDVRKALFGLVGGRWALRFYRIG
jgi:hypothetical protein